MVRYRVTVNGQTFEVTVEEVEGGGPTTAASAPVQAPAAASVQAHAPAATPPPPVRPVEAGSRPREGEGVEVRAPMPGIVTEVRVRPGQRVAAGDVLLLVEAMKMANEVTAPVSGAVLQLRVQAGDSVAAGQVLAVLG